eukprot:COSAG02_NODE_583_length_20010_cov_4.434584_15_plen_104_part_00
MISRAEGVGFFLPTPPFPPFVDYGLGVMSPTYFPPTPWGRCDGHLGQYVLQKQATLLIFWPNTGLTRVRHPSLNMHAGHTGTTGMRHTAAWKPLATDSQLRRL